MNIGELKEWRIENVLDSDQAIIRFAAHIAQTNNKEDMKSALEAIAEVLQKRLDAQNAPAALAS